MRGSVAKKLRRVATKTCPKDFSVTQFYKWLKRNWMKVSHKERGML